ncbi:MAG: flagellar export chaperone FliS [Verrucomicrobiales bacterium]|nr:flagellar export chaperone FliS [Verrucomicrobiales bacterium]
MKRQLIGKSYLQVATQTASPGHLVLMLYEGAIRFLERALQGFDMEDPAESNQTINNNILRAQAILDELNGALNVGEGGDVAASLRGLYNYLDRRLQESNLRKEQDGIHETIKHLGILRDAWREMLSKAPEPAEAQMAGFAMVG